VVRRLAVVRFHRFIGVITVDDLIVDLSADRRELSRLIMSEAYSHSTTVRPRQSVDESAIE
jgi:CBS domain-containing protein